MKHPLTIPSEAALPFPVYLLAAFLEGGAVMACEVLSARMIAPFYGTTMFVWSTVIGVTLAALALGYFIGGYLADRYARPGLLFTVLALGASLIALMPITARFALEASSGMDVRSGSIAAALVFLLPPLVCLGATSPVIIRLASKTVERTGRTAGTVYATSTLSGILVTFLLGFYIIPIWGITKPAYVAAALLALLPAVWFFSKKKLKAGVALLLVFAALPWFLFAKKAPPPSSQFQLRYKAEGLLGQLAIVDVQADPGVAFPHRRLMLVNRQTQTIIDLDSGGSLLMYSHAIAVAAAVKPAGSKALLLGLGGGVVANELLRLGFSVDAVEFDGRIVQAAKDWFQLDPRCRVITDDARHFVRTFHGQYDVVVFDTFSGEAPPSHVFTLESLEQVKKILAPGGLVCINFSGFLTGTEGLAAKAIARTLIAAGFHVKLLPTPGKESERNLVFLASLSETDFSKIGPARLNPFALEAMKVPLPLPLRDAATLDLSGAPLLTDDRPILELLHLPTGEVWRKMTLTNPATAGDWLFYD